MFGMLSVFSEFERAMIQARVKSGLDRAKAAGTKLGRARTAPAIEAGIKARLAEGAGMLKVAAEFKVGSGTVQRIKREMAATV
jgi:DNA invertase Pin-like site-specific DNA recombinase